MLLEFSVGNFRSFKEPVTLSMVAAKLNAKNPQLDQNNSFQVEDELTLLTSAAVYGANASGKSNLVKALAFMRWFVINSSKETQIEDPIDVAPFRLDTETEKAPSFFETVFYLDGVTFRYGFEATQESIESEWLFYAPHGKEAKLFLRTNNEIYTSRNFKGGRTIKSLTRPNALFLSVAAQFKNEIAIKILGWFASVGVISGLNDTGYRGFTAKKFSENPAFRTKILDLIRNSDIGINDIVVEEITADDPDAFPEDMPQELKDYLIKQISGKGEIIAFKSIHQKRCADDAREYIKFGIDEESEGTQKLLYLSGPVLDTLQKGNILVIDEIEARMHTLLTRKLIGLFNSKITNPQHAQLIFATHDTNLLSNKLFRRDQIWFTEKDEFGASHLYSLAELKVRNDSSFENDYLHGRYGGIPLLGEMRQVVIDQGGEDGDEGKKTSVQTAE